MTSVVCNAEVHMAVTRSIELRVTVTYQYRCFLMLRFLLTIFPTDNGWKAVKLASSLHAVLKK